MRERNSSETIWGFRNARETVIGLTRASLATSSNVIFRLKIDFSQPKVSV